MKPILIILIVGFYVLCSCNTPKPIMDTKSTSITLTPTSCGSYEVKNNQKTIGYIVYLTTPPKDKDIENRINFITQFENLIQKTYLNYYKNFYRTYWFFKNSVGDEILTVVMLSQKQTSLIPNWQCQEQDIDSYKVNRNHLFNKKHPQFITYNCTKARFKTLGDAEW